MNNNVSNSQPYGTQSQLYWGWHPFGRAIGTAVLSHLFTTTIFPTGLVYGGISGLTNVMFQPIYKKLDSKTTTPQAKTITYLFSKIIPWGISAAIIHKAFQRTNAPLFRLRPGVAVGTAFTMEIFSSANDYLLGYTEIKKSPY
jgi:hypothetical protein